ncbi:MAG: NAD(+)/NADH kinase, partial [Burkholderiales bacterium]
MPVAFPTIALIGKYKTPEVAEPVMRLARFLETRGVKVLLDRLTAAHIQNCPYVVLLLEDLGREADLAIVIGGDGTMLNIARTFAPYDVELVGINQGRLGFLTDISLDTMFETITAILDGQFVTEERMLFESEVWSGNNGGQERVFEVLAFNDVVVAKGFKGGLVDIEVRIDGQ